MENSQIDWKYARRRAWLGKLDKFLQSLPVERWHAFMKDGRFHVTFMSLACSYYGNINAIEMLLSQGVKLNFTCHYFGYRLHLYSECSPFEVSVYENHIAARVLISNGARLSRVNVKFIDRVTPELQNFERGVLRCISTIVILLGLKKRRNHVMAKLDKFLIQQELAVAIWTTRSDDAWHVPLMRPSFSSKTLKIK